MRLILTLLAMLWALPVLAQDMGVGDTPPWVDELPLLPDDPALRDLAQDGVHYLLSDHQVRWTDRRESYVRTVMLVTDRAGLERAASLSFDFDPSFEDLTLVRLVVLRDGVEIDLREQARVEVFRREERLEEGIIDGTLTAWLQVPGVRVGDVVDYATVQARRPIYPDGDRVVWSVLEWGVPVVLSRTVVLWPEDWPLNPGALPDRVSHAAGPGPDGTVRHDWQRIGHVPPPDEEAVPDIADPTAIVRLSADADWSGVSRAFAPSYAADHPLPPDWEARLAGLTALPEAERAFAALRLVQDEVRYVSLSVGAGGYFPRAPQVVLAQGAGDCKDKALLLLVALKRLGVTAVAGLTDLDDGHALPREVPMAGAFDHVIVRIDLASGPVWVDPTATHQGGVGATAAPPDYGWALPLDGSAALEPLPVTAEAAWSTDVTERYQFTALGVLLEVRSVYRGGAADDRRASFATTPRAQKSREYLDYYAGRYPGLRMMAEIELADDRTQNRLELVERYLLPQRDLVAGGLDRDFDLAAEDFAADLPEGQRGPRSLPMQGGGPALHRHRVVVRGAPVDFEAPDPVRLRNGSFSFDFRAAAPAFGALDLEWEHRRSGAVVPAAEVAALMRDRAAVQDATWFGWDVSAR